jgi:t-SNARE complex subunit (syntaxin)
VVCLGCDSEALKMRRPWPSWGYRAKDKIFCARLNVIIIIIIIIIVTYLKFGDKFV